MQDIGKILERKTSLQYKWIRSNMTIWVTPKCKRGGTIRIRMYNRKARRHVRCSEESDLHIRKVTRSMDLKDKI